MATMAPGPLRTESGFGGDLFQERPSAENRSFCSGLILSSGILYPKSVPSKNVSDGFAS
jgi:hypothetical protein